MKRVKVSAIFITTLLGVGLLVLRGEHSAKAESKCAVSTLKGNYVYAQDGFNVTGDTSTQRTPFAQTGKEIYDGRGNMSGAATASLNGQIVRSTYVGTCTINPDCTDAIIFTDNATLTFHYDIFIEDNGQEFAFLQTDEGVVTAAFERRR